MTIAGLLLGRGGSGGFPGKNLYPILGRPIVAYPLIAARDSKFVDRLFVSTDSQEIMDVAKAYGAEIIVRPPELCTASALAEDAYVHGYETIRSMLADREQPIEMLVLLMANAAAVTADLIDQGVDILRNDPTMDSAVTVSRYNMWSPIRARRLMNDGSLQPFVPFEAIGDPETFNCDRDSQGDVWFADMGVCVVRPRCIENIEHGLLPQKWLGNRIAAIPSWGGCDVDYEWQMPGVEFWLREHGVTTPVSGERG